jgi:CelD/BcsL family acetyltransferase involved in cellulose biosynthesis
LLAAWREEALVGVAPLFAARSAGGVRYELLGTGVWSPVEPHVRQGLELDVAAAFAAALASASPRTGAVVLNRLATDSAWPRMLTAAWPGRRPWLDITPNADAPLVRIEGRTFEDWFAGRSHHFRSHMRRGRRMLERAGGRVYRSSPETIASDMEAFVRLHRARWHRHGGSRVLDQRVEAMLLTAVAGDRAAIRLWVAEVAGEVVSVQLFVADAGYVHYWQGAYDHRWAAVQPGHVVLLAAVEEACRRGDRIVDLGEGAHPYKLRFSDVVEPRATFRLVGRSRRLGAPVSPAELLDYLERRRIAPAVDQLRARLARGRVGGR